MWCWSRRWLVLAALVALPAQADFWQATIHSAEWREHADRGRLLQLDAVSALLARFEEVEGAVVTIRYPGGDAGNAWAVTLRDRLVGYGVPSAHIQMQPGSGGLDILHLSLVDGG